LQQTIFQTLGNLNIKENFFIYRNTPTVYEFTYQRKTVMERKNLPKKYPSPPHFELHCMFHTSYTIFEIIQLIVKVKKKSLNKSNTKVNYSI
jgi:hypothetical protein